jgi:ribosomal protein S18 acetylase RimI-like enzyme
MSFRALNTQLFVAGSPMIIQNMSHDDFQQIKRDITEFWGEKCNIIDILTHPMFMYEFGNTAYVIKDNQEVVAYLLGFISQTSRTAYVHMVACKPSCRRKGYAKALYEYFINYSKSVSCTKIKAITSPNNKESIAFHQSLGMSLLGKPNDAGIHVVSNYAGPGKDRVVFEKQI